MNTTNENKAIENVMMNMGVIPNTNPSWPSGNNSHLSQIQVNPSYASCNKNLTKNQQAASGSPQAMTKLQQTPTASCPSGNSSYPSSSLVKPQLIPVNNSLLLSEQGKAAKADLEVLVVTGKTKDFLGKQLTRNDLDYMSEKDILKYHRLYQSAYACRVNDTFSKLAIKSYAKFKLASMCLPIADENKLYEDMRSDYILMSEIDKWTGWLAIRMGSLMAVASTSFITPNNVDYQKAIVQNADNFSKINGGNCEETGASDKPGNSGEAGTSDRNNNKSSKLPSKKKAL